MFNSWKWRAATVLFASCLLSLHARAQSILDQVHTVAGTDVAVPVEHSFTIAADGTYQVTLVDLGATLNPPAPVVSMKLAITSGGTIVGTPLTKAGSAQFTATKGTYVIHVIGLPDAAQPASGSIGVQITNLADNSQVAAFSDTLALPSAGIPNNQGVLDDSFTVPADGSYQINLSDFQFPQTLDGVTLAITAQGGGLITTLPGGTNPVSLQEGVTYRILAIGEAPSGGVKAGLYGVNISPAGGGATVYAKSVPIGAVTLLGEPALTAGSYTLTFSDLLYPNPLSPLGAVVALDGQPAAQLTAGGSQTFTTTAGTYQVFALGLPHAPAATGSYSVSLKPVSGAPVLSVARAVSTSGGSIFAYSYDTSVTTAGSYALDIADFGLSAPFTSISAAVIQNGQVVGNGQGAGTWLSAAGSLNVTPVVGPASLLVFAQPGTGGSLFGIDLTASGSSPLFATTQGVGQLFGTQSITVPSAGSYTVTVNDVGFPVNLQTLAVAVTQGANRLGAIFSGGSFNFTGAPGTTYFVNFIAQPNTGPTATDHAGTYSIDVAPTPAAPVVTLSSSATSVTSGGTVTLTWSSQNATSCAGSSTPAGVWSTGQLSGNAQATSAITTSTTFTLKCSGAGGDQTQTVSVGINAPSSNSGGGGHGGGTVSLDLLAVLAGLTLVRLQRKTVGRSEGAR